jgi:hypothetical protein
MSSFVHLSPSGEWKSKLFKANSWSSGDNRAKTWTYWWLDLDSKKRVKAEYEVICEGLVVVPRTKLVKSPKLFAETGFIDDEPDRHGPIGGAAKLDVGIYSVDFYLTVGEEEHLLRGVRFEVSKRRAEFGGRQIFTPLPKSTDKT